MTERSVKSNRKNRMLMIIPVMMIFFIVTPVAAEDILNDWTQATGSAAFSPRHSHVSVVYDDRMWVIGGNDGYHKNDTWYSTDGITWTQATASAAFSPRVSFSSVVYDGRMWVIGGHDEYNLKNDVWYSTNGVNWTQATASAAFSPRCHHRSVVYDDRMWVIGGSDGSSKNETWYSTDGVNWTQATASAAFSARFAQSSVVYDGKMWVIGGLENFEYKNDTWYSTDGATWAQANASAGFPGRLYHTSVIYDGKMWVIGGAEGASGKNDVWYSTDGATWTQANALTIFSPRYTHSSVIYDGKMWVIGGYGGSLKNDVWYTSAVDTVPTVSIDNASLSEPGEETTVVLKLDSAPDGLSGYNLEVSVENSSVGEFTGVVFPGWAEGMNTHGTLPASQNLLVKASDTGYLVEPGASNITLATLTVKGLYPGISAITISNTNFDDDDGDDIFPVITAGTLTVDYVPSLLNITPSSGYNNGSVNVTLTGTWFMPGATVNLTRPGTVIAAANLSYISDTRIDGIFNLSGQDTGAWNITLTNPDGKTATITDGFTINQILLPINGVMPTDPNEDGKYEDLNGNGQADYADVNIFFVSYSWIAENEPEDAFDFNNNGRLDMADIVVLFDSIS